MEILARPVKAPAYRPKKALKALIYELCGLFYGRYAIKRRSPLRTRLSGFLSAITPCGHKRRTLPFCDTQTCLDCGRIREYRYHPAGVEKSYATIFRGPWRKGGIR